jgi:hypothetical protein
MAQGEQKHYLKCLQIYRIEELDCTRVMDHKNGKTSGRRRKLQTLVKY